MFVKKGSREYQAGEAFSDQAQRLFADKSPSIVLEDKYTPAAAGFEINYGSVGP